MIYGMMTSHAQQIQIQTFRWEVQLCFANTGTRLDETFTFVARKWCHFSHWWERIQQNDNSVTLESVRMNFSEERMIESEKLKEQEEKTKRRCIWDVAGEQKSNIQTSSIQWRSDDFRAPATTTTSLGGPLAGPFSPAGPRGRGALATPLLLYAAKSQIKDLK